MIEIFGIGYNKTGTTSLTAALNRLGFPCLHNPRQRRLNLILQGEHFGYKATCDYPVWERWQDIVAIYPNAKYILSNRNVDDWSRSREAHVARNKVRGRKWIATESDDRERYLEHTETVRRFFHGSSNFLEVHICEGEIWDNLCRFLGKPIPTIPFPHKNRTPYPKLRRKGIFVD